MRRILCFALLLLFCFFCVRAIRARPEKKRPCPTWTPSGGSMRWCMRFIPRSFQDTNGDGIGDLNGITQRLPYP